jgi:endonuclease-3
MKDDRNILRIISLLKKEYPEPKTALNFTNPFELLVATVLSAQTTDVLVNKVTKNLFQKYKSLKDYIDTPIETLEKDISSINFYKTKAKNIQAAALMIKENFNSSVPKSMDELIKLPGVARKTANIILYNAYGINEGIAVDTHVKRLSNRLGLTKHHDPQKIESDLMSITPKEEWGEISHLLILHGRKVCQAKKPRHSECVLFELCPSK